MLTDDIGALEKQGKLYISLVSGTKTSIALNRVNKSSQLAPSKKKF